MNSLKTDDQHWSVRFQQDRWSNRNAVLGSDCEEEVVERCVVEFAQSQSVRHLRLTFWLRIANDVGGIEEFGVTETAEGAHRSVSVKNGFAERRLMNASAHRGGVVRPPNVAILTRSQEVVALED